MAITLPISSLPKWPPNPNPRPLRLAFPTMRTIIELILIAALCFIAYGAIDPDGAGQMLRQAHRTAQQLMRG